MFDIGWQELFLIGVVALIVVGPKDLPKALRTGARVLHRARAMSREFQNGLAELAREAELDEIKSKVERTARFDLGEELRKVADPTGKLSADFDPAEFNRQIKAAVEAGPPQRPATPATPEPAAPDLAASQPPAPLPEPSAAAPAIAEPAAPAIAEPAAPAASGPAPDAASPLAGPSPAGQKGPG